MIRVCKEIEVDIDLSDIDTEDLIDELESRNEWLPPLDPGPGVR